MMCRVLLVVSMLFVARFAHADAASEAKAVDAFKRTSLPAWRAKLDKAAGTSIPVEIDWPSLATADCPDHYTDTLASTYFTPLVDAMTRLSVDDPGKAAIKTVKTIKIVNTRMNGYPSGFSFEGGVLVLDHHPCADTTAVKDRADQIVSLVNAINAVPAEDPMDPKFECAIGSQVVQIANGDLKCRPDPNPGKAVANHGAKTAKCSIDEVIVGGPDGAHCYSRPRTLCGKDEPGFTEGNPFGHADKRCEKGTTCSYYGVCLPTAMFPKRQHNLPRHGHCYIDAECASSSCKSTAFGAMGPVGECK